MVGMHQYVSLGCVLTGEHFVPASFEGRWSCEKKGRGRNPYVVRGQSVPSVRSLESLSRLLKKMDIYIHRRASVTIWILEVQVSFIHVGAMVLIRVVETRRGKYTRFYGAMVFWNCARIDIGPILVSISMLWKRKCV